MPHRYPWMSDKQDKMHRFGGRNQRTRKADWTILAFLCRPDHERGGGLNLWLDIESISQPARVLENCRRVILKTPGLATGFVMTCYDWLEWGAGPCQSAWTPRRPTWNVWAQARHQHDQLHQQHSHGLQKMLASVNEAMFLELINFT